MPKLDAMRGGNMREGSYTTFPEGTGNLDEKKASFGLCDDTNSGKQTLSRNWQ